MLPFANMSGDAEQEYFSDGISEDITTDLSKISALAVTARNTAFTFKGQAVDVCDVARKLGVSHVLEGSVRKAGSRVRITAQLIDGATGDHVWAERYDRDLTDIFAIQDEISKAIVDALKVKLLPEEKKAIEQRGTTQRRGLQALSHGPQLLGDGQLRRHPPRAAGDPDLPAGGRDRSELCAGLGADRARPGQPALFASAGPAKTALAAAERALSIDPDDRRGALRDGAASLSRAAAIDEADAEIATALELDPNSWEVNREAASDLLSLNGEIDRGRPLFRESGRRIIETDYHAWGMLLSCLPGARRTRDGREPTLRQDDMVSQAERVLAEDPSNGAALGIGAGGLAIFGQGPSAPRNGSTGRLLIDPDNLNMRYNFACALTAHLGDPEARWTCLSRFSKRVTERLIDTPMADPDLDSLRDDPRFQEMMARRAASGLATS